MVRSEAALLEAVRSPAVNLWRMDARRGIAAHGNREVDLVDSPGGSASGCTQVTTGCAEEHDHPFPTP